jgi:hypothetical protein
LFSYWQGENAFDDHRQAFETAVAAGPVVLRGRLSEYSAKKEGLLRRYPFWTGIITLSLLVTSFVSLWERVGELLESPDIYIELSPDHPPNLLGSGIITPIKFLVTNRCRFAAVSVDLKAAFAKSGAPANPDLKATSLSRIEPGTTKELFIRPQLPAFTSDDAPIPYQFRVKAEASSGLWHKRPFDFTLEPINVWGVLAASPPSFTSNSEGECSAQGAVYSGLSQSGTVHFTVSHPNRAIQSVLIQVNINGAAVSSSAPFWIRSKHGLTVQQQVRLQSLEQFGIYNYSISVLIPGLKSDECSQVQVQTSAFGGATQ